MIVLRTYVHTSDVGVLNEVDQITGARGQIRKIVGTIHNVTVLDMVDVLKQG